MKSKATPMSGERLSKEAEERLLKAGEKLFRTAYPNPERSRRFDSAALKAQLDPGVAAVSARITYVCIFLFIGLAVGGFLGLRSSRIETEHKQALQQPAGNGKHTASVQADAAKK